MKKHFIKTDHFWQRAWERGINQADINNLLKEVKPGKAKTLMIFGRDKLRKSGIKLPNKTHLIIVSKKNVLLTIFTVPDLFSYLKQNVSNAKIIIL